LKLLWTCRRTKSVVKQACCHQPQLRELLVHEEKGEDKSLGGGGGGAKRVRGP